jgi:hypothetical protein
MLSVREALHRVEGRALWRTSTRSITGKGYGNATADPDDVIYEIRERPATVSGCRMYIVDGLGEYRDPPGPELGTFRLERDPLSRPAAT